MVNMVESDKESKVVGQRFTVDAWKGVWSKGEHLNTKMEVLPDDAKQPKMVCVYESFATN